MKGAHLQQISNPGQLDQQKPYVDSMLMKRCVPSGWLSQIKYMMGLFLKIVSLNNKLFFFCKKRDYVFDFLSASLTNKALLK